MYKTVPTGFVRFAPRQGVSVRHWFSAFILGKRFSSPRSGLVPMSLRGKILKVILCLLAVSSLAVGWACNRGDKNAANLSAPIRELRWESHGKGFGSYGYRPNVIYASTVSPKYIEVWKWEKDNVVKCLDQELPTWSLDVVPLYDSVIGLTTPVDKLENWPFVFMDTKTKKMLNAWEPTLGWGYWKVSISLNGQYIALLMEERQESTSSGYDGNNQRFRIDTIDVANKRIRCTKEFGNNGFCPCTIIRTIAITNDGRYVALGGLQNGMAVFDCQESKELWRSQPEIMDLYYVCFSPDGDSLYAGGVSGEVYGFETKTKKVIDRWWATQDDQEHYGHRISALTVSPDGMWVAAGTGAGGEVYVWNTKTKKKQLYNHALQTILMLAFSPDSKYLASVAGGKIKIWQLPQE